MKPSQITPESIICGDRLPEIGSFRDAFILIFGAGQLIAATLLGALLVETLDKIEYTAIRNGEPVTYGPMALFIISTIGMTILAALLTFVGWRSIFTTISFAIHVIMTLSFLCMVRDSFICIPLGISALFSIAVLLLIRGKSSTPPHSA